MSIYNSTLLAQVKLSDITYYITNRGSSVTLESKIYIPLARSFGNPTYIGNIGNKKKEIASFNCTYINGAKFDDENLAVDITKNWNNSEIEIKIYDFTVTTFASCKPYGSGIIKNFRINSESMSHTVDQTDRIINIKKLPLVVCEDQSKVTTNTKSLIKKISGNVIQYASGNDSYFSVGEYIHVKGFTGTSEHAVIIDIDITTDYITLGSNLSGYFWVGAGMKDYIEKSFLDLPNISKSKTIPIQCGDLTSNGFGKLITTSKIPLYRNYIIDTGLTDYIGNLGAYDDGNDQFYDSLVANNTNYIKLDNSELTFKRYNYATCSGDTGTTGGRTTIAVNGGLNILYNTESLYNGYDSGGINYILIDLEIMMLLERPTSSNTILVERGMYNTDIVNHASGTNLLFVSDFQASGTLQYAHRFVPNDISNIYCGDALDMSTSRNSLNYSAGELKDIIDWGTPWSAWEMYGKYETGLNPVGFNMDLTFKTPNIDFSVFLFKPAISFEYYYKSSVKCNNKMWLNIANITQKTRYNAEFNTQDGDFGSYITANLPLPISSDWGVQAWDISNYWDTPAIPTTPLESITYQSQSGSDTFNVNNTLKHDDDTISWTPKNWSTPTTENWYQTVDFNSLKDLSKKWKLTLGFDTDQGLNVEQKFRFYWLGIWAYFTSKIESDNTVAKIKGRIYSSETATMLGTTVSALIENPVGIIAELLINDLGYTSSNFTSNWSTVCTYFNTATNFVGDAPKISFSYGGDDKQEKAFVLLLKIMQDYNLSFYLNENNKFEIINNHQIYFNTPSAYKIRIEEMSFNESSSQDFFELFQTGTDLLYNDITLDYNRNNYNDNYNSQYKLSNGDLVRTGYTLQDAKDDYYNGDTKNLKIKSEFIYNSSDAGALTNFIIKDQAETHFYAKIKIDFWHYTDYNSKSEQYRPGDIIYFVGRKHGLILSDDNKFYIQKVIYTDDGQSVKIEAKSIDPIADFTIIP